MEKKSGRNLLICQMNFNKLKQLLWRQKILKAEAVKLKKSIREVEMKSNLQNNDFIMEIKAKNLSISVLEKKLNKISAIYQNILIQHETRSF